MASDTCKSDTCKFKNNINKNIGCVIFQIYLSFTVHEYLFKFTQTAISAKIIKCIEHICSKKLPKIHSDLQYHLKSILAPNIQTYHVHVVCINEILLTLQEG